MAELPRYLQLLWDREPPGRRGPRPARSITEIGKAAVELADRDGLAGITVKRVAEAVELTTMSLYRYVDSKDDLHAVMLDVALGPPEFDYGRTGWRRRLSMWAGGIAERRLAHPWMVEVNRTSPPLTPHHLAWTDAGLRALAYTNLSAEEKFSVLLVLDGWCAHHVRQSLQLGLVGAAEPGSDRAYPEHIAMLVDPDRFPDLVAASIESMRGGADEDWFHTEFERGLNLLLNGVDSLVRRRAVDKR